MDMAPNLVVLYREDLDTSKLWDKVEATDSLMRSNHPSNTRTLTTTPTILEEETTKEGTRRITTVEVEDTVDGTTTTSTITITTTTRVSTKGSTITNTRQDMDSRHMAWATVLTISTRGADTAPITWIHTVCSSRTVQDTNRVALEEPVDSMAKKTLTSSLTKAKEREREVTPVALAATQTCSSFSRDLLKHSKEEQASSRLVFKVVLVIALALLLRVLALVRVLVEPTRVGPTRAGEEQAGRAIIK